MFQFHFGPQQPQYGQPPAQYGYGQPGYGQQPVPGVNLITKGNGIDNNEYNQITYAVYDVIQNRVPQTQGTLSKRIGDTIKQRLGNDWYVMVSDVNTPDPDFSFTKVKSGDYMVFSYGNGKFNIFKI